MIKLVGGIVIMLFCLALLSEVGFKGKRAVSLVCVTVLFAALARDIDKLFGEFVGFAEGGGIGAIASSAAKIIGSGYLFGICSDMAAELGENFVSKAVVTFGKIEILLIVLPYFMDILNLGISLIK